MFCVFVIVIKKIKKMQKWIWCISFFDLSESSSSSNTLDFRKHQLPASQISPGLILHEFPNCSSRDWRRSAATVQQSQKKKKKKKTLAALQWLHLTHDKLEKFLKLTAQRSCRAKKKPVLHIRKKKKKKSSEQDDEIITSNRDISALWLVFLLVYERRNLT